MYSNVYYYFYVALYYMFVIPTSYKAGSGARESGVS